MNGEWVNGEIKKIPKYIYKKKNYPAPIKLFVCK